MDKVMVHYEAPGELASESVGYVARVAAGEDSQRTLVPEDLRRKSLETVDFGSDAAHHP